MRIPTPTATGDLLMTALMLPTVSLAQSAGIADKGRVVITAISDTAQGTIDTVTASGDNTPAMR